MSRIYNFSAGPAMLPTEVLQQAQAEMLDWHDIGASIMEVGHRGADFKKVAEQAEADLRELMAVPADYAVLFLAGGATAQFAMVPLNLFGTKMTADYIDTGIWSAKAIAEAGLYGAANVIARVTLIDGVTSIPLQQEWQSQLNPDAAYLHYTPNETIAGLQFDYVPKPLTAAIPLVADMSSMILSQPCNVRDYGIIYAGAQKNIGQAGITVVIIRRELLQAPLPFTPTLYNYQIEVENGSFFNTPPTYSWYIAGLMFAWMKKMGGVSYFTELNLRKAQKLYAVIDSHRDFYLSRIAVNNRSRMNVTFDLPSPDLTTRFLTQAAQAGMINLSGHRVVGGVRASIYNAMSEAGVDCLVEFMREFVKRA